jgi:hypothetical protein
LPELRLASHGDRDRLGSDGPRAAAGAAAGERRPPPPRRRDHRIIIRELLDSLMIIIREL